MNGTCESANPLDIRYLKRRGFLVAGFAGELSWTRGGRTNGSVQLFAQGMRIDLVYSWRYGEGDWQVAREEVDLVETEQKLGGRRQWFRCPGCHKRCAILYAGMRFRCRKCSQLTYNSQREDPFSRSISQAQKIRMQLGGTASLLDPFPEKPRGMHWRTYEKHFFRAAKQERLVSSRGRAFVSALNARIGR